MKPFILMLAFTGWAFSTLIVKPWESQKAAAPCQVKELFKPLGWEIPGLSKAKAKTHGHYISEGIPENVLIDVFEVDAAQASLIFVGLKSCEMAQLNERSVDVSKIERFTMNGHIFGYRVTGTVAGFDKQGRRIHYGSEERVYYYDPNGSGKFSVMHYDNGELIFKIVVPDWVKQKSE
ncbi:MAG TPA: hypothetical protein VKQ72_16015 [Aggregatilineales bacterium]|nr:hypothetical protein [Aggregatilineales bacterium]